MCGLEYFNSTNTSDYITQECPFDYCVEKPAVLNLVDPDEQCAFNRTGTLCGECRQGLSLVFASSECQECSNYYLFLLIPFALAGVALVAFILMLNMTVATGTIHGLIFYANILAANRSVFVPFDTPNFLTVFVSWLNLDLGIKTCFYDGMNSYGKLLLQLVFPAYVFLLIGIIIALCNCSQKIANLFGKRNPEATLYTLIFLSYSKLIRLIITALQFTTISYPDGTNKIVWLYNANVPYFTASHIPRFVIAGIIIILGTIYTTVLLFGQLFNRCSEYRVMKWTTHKYYIRFVKAHHAPFSDQHRYWVGLLLLARLAHYLISSFVSDTSIVILSVSLIGFGLILYKQLICGHIYRTKWLDSLESLFLVNLTYCLGSRNPIWQLYNNSTWNQQVLVLVFLSIDFITFLALVLYHIINCCQTKISKIYHRLSNGWQFQCSSGQRVLTEEESWEENLEDDDPLIELGELQNDTQSDNLVIDSDRYVTPPIIRSAVSLQYNQLREPALDDLAPVTPENYQ